MTLRTSTAAAAILAISSSAYATNSVHQVALQVQRDGNVIVDTFADLTLDATDEEIGQTSGVGNYLVPSLDLTEGATRVVARIESDNNEYFTVQVQYLEKQNSEWQMLGEPTVIIRNNDEGFVEFSADRGMGQHCHYKITIIANSSDPKRGDGQTSFSEQGTVPPATIP